MTEPYKSKCYCTNLRRSANKISDFYSSALKNVGLTVAQYYLLINLSRLGSANITHWSEFVGLDRSTMVRNIKPLQTRGLIVETDGHGKTYSLSDEGANILEKAIPIWQKAQEDMEKFLGKDDTEAILRIGAKLQELEKCSVN